MKLPKVICIACGKGGVGKSTTSINLAVGLSARHAVELLDLDYQKTATIFNRLRTDEGHEPLAVKTADSETQVKNVIKKCKGILIIDTGAFDTPTNRRAMLMADMVITPMSDSIVDLYGLMMYEKVIRELKEADKNFKVYILPNKIEPRNNDMTEITAVVKKHKANFTLLKSIIFNRKDYRNAFENGLGITELKKATAGEEFTKLIKEIEKCLK
ncbi:MAG TPA: ParA family protein [Candidatus Gastranaerophilaceae bacterium]|nr:ParA family protein [Candidatus Gastranaerophilaceae bacterium]